MASLGSSIGIKHFIVGWFKQFELIGESTKVELWRRIFGSFRYSYLGVWPDPGPWGNLWKDRSSIDCKRVGTALVDGWFVLIYITKGDLVEMAQGVVIRQPGHVGYYRCIICPRSLAAMS